LHSCDLQCLSVRDPAHMRAYLFWSMLGHHHVLFVKFSSLRPLIESHGDDVADPTNHAKEIPQKSRKPTLRLVSGVTGPSSSQEQTLSSNF
jgi:hypothetical protein